MTASTPAGRAAAIYHCPFCADEDLRPAEGSADAWTCRSCARTFVVRLLAAGLMGLQRLVPGSVLGWEAVAEPSVGEHCVSLRASDL